MTRGKWHLNPYNLSDKWIELITPEGDLFARIDYDDVDHREVNRRIPLILAALNGVTV